MANRLAGSRQTLWRFGFASAAAFIVSLASLPMTGRAATPVQLDGALGVANVTSGATTYSKTTPAAAGQTIKLQLYYLNAGNGPARDTRLKFSVPSTAGTAQQVGAQLRAANGTTVDQAAVVQLNRPDATLQYVPGSATWRRNTAAAGPARYTSSGLSDAVVNDPQGVRLGDALPSIDHAGTVTILVRVVQPGVVFGKQAQPADRSAPYSSGVTVKPGETVRYRLNYQNGSSASQRQVAVRDALPPHFSLVPGSTRLTNATYPQSTAYASDTVSQAGIGLGDYGAGANAYLTFEAKAAAANQFNCGLNTYSSASTLRLNNGSEYAAAATTNVQRDCGQVPVAAPNYSCDQLKLQPAGGRSIRLEVAYTARGGAALKTVTYDFGDGSAPLTTDKTAATYTYAKDGTYTVGALLSIRVGTATKPAASQACVKTIKVAAATNGGAELRPPKSGPLPSTGSPHTGLVVGLATLAGVLMYRQLLYRRHVL